MKIYIKVSVIIVGITFFVIGIGLLVYYEFNNNKNDKNNNDIFSYKDTKIKIPKYIIPKEINTEELVIAMCNEDVTWVSKYIDKYKLITIYNKCGRVVNFNSPNVKVIESPNIGTCDHAYLSYIIDRYDDLPDFIEFTKGWREPKKEYNNCLACNNDNELYNKLMGFKLDNHQFGNIVNRNKDYVWHKSGYKNMGEWIENNEFLDKELYKKNICNIIFGGQFGSTKEQIQKTSKEIWEKIRSQQKYTNEEVDHFIERSWRILLCRPKYKLVIVAIFKNEAIAMREWLEHYIRQGVEHFYMIDNGSTDDWKSQVQGFPVTIYTDNEKHKQTEHYNNYFLEEVKRISEWAMVVDLDEFMYARNGFSTIPEYLDTLGTDIEEVSVKWKMFGSNGHIKQPKSIIDGFTMRLNYDKKINESFNYFKSICRTLNLLKLGVHTNSIENKNNKIILEVNSEIMLDNSPLHLNHYAIQSWEFFKNIKMKRGDASNKNSETVRDKEYFYKYDTNDIVDNELLKIYDSYYNKYKNILTTIITTAPQKSIPSDKIIRKTIDSLNLVPIIKNSNIVIGFDGCIINNSMLDAKCKQEFLCYKYDEYKNNVKEYARSILPNVKFVELKERSCLSTLLKECMKDVSTPFVNIMQQDLPILKSFNIEKVMKIMNNKDNIDCVRYSCWMSNEKHEKFALDNCKKILDPVSINIENMNFIQCSVWSDQNHIAKISHYNDFVWKNAKPYSFMEHDLFCYPVNNNYKKIWYLGDKDDYFCEHTDGRNTN